MKVRLKLAGRRDAGTLALLLYLFLTLPSLAAPWVQTASLPDTYVGQSLVYASNYLYQAGGGSGNNGPADGTNVFYAQVNDDGTTGAWTNATSLPKAVLYHAGVAANGFVYVLGGESFDPNNPVNDGFSISMIVYYAKINPDGSLGSWQTANSLPSPLCYLSASVWNNQIYVIGGVGDFIGSTYDTVYSATIQGDGSLSAWTAQTPMPVAIDTEAEAANGFLYVLGGIINGGNTFVNTVYFSQINADGTLAGWNQTTPLPQSESNFGAIAANGLVYSIGGFDGSQVTDSFYVAAVNGDGSLGSWSSGASLPQPLYLHAVAASGCYIFVSGGASDMDNSSAVYSMALPAPPATPTLGAGSFTNGNFSFQLASGANTGFGLLASTDLMTWTNIGWGFTGTNGSLLFQDTNAASFPNRCYRAYWPLP
jgi:hypothetical protein